MKNPFVSVLLLTVVGLAVLAAGAIYFGAPLFGWVIMAAIFAVFIAEQWIALKKIRQVAEESAVLEACENRGISAATGDGVVARRVKLSRELLSKKIRLDSPIAFEVLNNSVGIGVPRGAGGTVILLGLMGTFFGLMASIATAGGAMDNTTTQGTLDTIQHLFQNMKGIFGTSLCGLFAALILNGSRTLMISARDSFLARLDALTLNMQGENSDEEQDKTGLERLFETVEKNLNQIASSVQAGLSGIVNKVAEELAATTVALNDNVSKSVEGIANKINSSVEKVSAEMETSVKGLNDSLAHAVSNMNGSVENLGSVVSASLSGAFTPMENSVKALSVSVESVPSKLEEKLNGISETLNSCLGSIADGVKSSLEGVSSSTQNSLSETSVKVAQSVAQQVQLSSQQWNAFMERLEEKTTDNVEAQREGLETLKNVALQVAEKAQAGSAELSASVSEKLGTLSNDILSAFQKLSETSSVLLEAQKALTESIDNRVVKEKEASDALGLNIVETAQLMRVNQSELSANLEMLRAGLETILEKLSGDTAEHEEEENFVEHLNQSLEAFHERASEVLVENAVKTQEILLEVLEQSQRGTHPVYAPSESPKVEG